jgi:hypothetical protein
VQFEQQRALGTRNWLAWIVFLLELGVLGLELAHALEIRHADTRVLRAPGVVRRRADDVFAYQLRYRHPGIAFLQDCHDLGFRKPRLLHYPSRDDRESLASTVYRAGEPTR